MKIGIALDKAGAPDLYRGDGSRLALSSTSGFRAGGRRRRSRAADRRERRPGLCPGRRAGGARRRVLEHRWPADPPDRGRERLADRAVPLAGARAHADPDHRAAPPRPPDRRVPRRRLERCRRRASRSRAASSAWVLRLQQTSVANATFMLGASPFFGALLGRWLLGETIRRATVLAIAAALRAF